MNITVCFFFVLQSGETALHVAARYGNVDVVQYLCSIHANPDLTDRVSNTRHMKVWNMSLLNIYYIILLQITLQLCVIGNSYGLVPCISMHTRTHIHTVTWPSLQRSTIKRNLSPLLLRSFLTGIVFKPRFVLVYYFFCDVVNYGCIFYDHFHGCTLVWC